MRKREQQAMATNLTVSNKPSSSSDGNCFDMISSGGNYFDLIPLDLVMSDIFSKLSGKCMGRCRCVSKLWSSIFRRGSQNLLFPIKSSNQPRFLFAFVLWKSLFFFSSPQPQNPDDNLSLVATRQYTNSGSSFDRVCLTTRGLICIGMDEGDSTFARICNPMTGQYVTTPILRKGSKSCVRYKFGYDPIEKHFKVLCLFWFFGGRDNKLCLQHHVLTLDIGNGNGNLLWRKIQCCDVYKPLYGGICINGVLYYLAYTGQQMCMIVSFDVRTEKFGFINSDQELAYKIRRGPLDLIDYKGKLSVFDDGGRDDPFNLWVLEDANEGIWSKHVYEKPYRVEFHQKNQLHFAGMTDCGDIVLCAHIPAENPLCIYYYNLESKVMVRVRIKVPAYESLHLRASRFYTFTNYVDEVKLF